MTKRHETKSPAQFEEWKRTKHLQRALDKIKAADPVWWERFSFEILGFQRLQEVKRPTRAHEQLAMAHLKRANAMLREKGIAWMQDAFFPQPAPLAKPLEVVK